MKEISLKPRPKKLQKPHKVRYLVDILDLFMISIGWYRGTVVDGERFYVHCKREMI